jgi:hypothetical protein
VLRGYNVAHLFEHIREALHLGSISESLHTVATRRSLYFTYSGCASVLSVTNKKYRLRNLKHALYFRDATGSNQQEETFGLSQPRWLQEHRKIIPHLRENKMKIALEGVAKAGRVIIAILLEHVNKVDHHVWQLVYGARHVLDQHRRSCAQKNNNFPTNMHH